MCHVDHSHSQFFDIFRSVIQHFSHRIWSWVVQHQFFGGGQATAEVEDEGDLVQEKPKLDMTWNNFLDDLGFCLTKWSFFLTEMFSRVDPGGSIVDLLPMFRSKVSNMIQSFSSFGLGKVYNYEILWAICGNQMNYINLYHHFLTIIIGNVTIYEMVIRRVVSSDEPSPKDLRNFCRRCRRPSRVVEKKNPGDLPNHELNRCK